MNVLKNHLLVVDKNIQALIVKIVPALQACLAKAKQHKPVQTVFAVIQLKKVAMQVKAKAQASETQIPTLHAALDVVSNQY